MKEGVDFHKLATNDNWISFGEWLNSVVENPQKYGFNYSEEALQAIADIRGTKAASLRNPIIAAAWLEKNHPNVFKRKPQWLGMMQVLILSRIASHDEEQASKIAPHVFSGDLSQADVKRILDEVRLEKSSSGDAGKLSGTSALQRSLAFERRAKHFFKTNSDQVFGKKGLTVQGGRSLEPLSADLLVYKGSSIICAIEIRGPRLRVHPAYIVDQLARLALLLRKVPEVLYVVPERSEYDLAQLEQTRAMLEINGVRFASLPEGDHLKVSDLKFEK